MADACEAWIELSDRQALGEALTEAERAFMAAHAAGCVECAREQGVWDRLATSVEGSPAPRRSNRKPRPIAWALGVATAAAALFLLTREPAPRLVVRDGAQLELDGTLVAAGTPLREGALTVARDYSCVTVEPAVRACLEPGSVMRIAELSARQRRLELLQGKLLAELAPQPTGTSFGVITRDGDSIAIGTAFSVEVPTRGEVVTRVMHGVVLVRDRAGKERRLAAHHKATATGQTLALPWQEESRELSRLSPLAQAEAVRAATPNGAAPVVPAPPSAVAVEAPNDTPPVELRAGTRKARKPPPVSEPFVSTPPVQSPDVEREHARDVNAEPARVGAAEGDQPALEGAERASLPPVVPQAATSTPIKDQERNQPVVPRPAEEARAPTPGELLAAARVHKARGDVRAALAAYHTLQQLAPQSPEAHAALVPQGELLLARGHAHDARIAFERYLRSGGALAQEASYGRVRALRKLGEHPMAARAAEEFLRTYPRSALAASLRTAPTQ